MSFSFPESPILLYPSLARELGVEAAVLYTLYYQAIENQRQTGTLQLSDQQWMELGSFWSEDQLAQLTSQLVAARYIDASFSSGNGVSIRLQNDTGEDHPIEEIKRSLDSEPVSRLQVIEEPPQPTQEHRVFQPTPPPGSRRHEPEDTPYYPDATGVTTNTVGQHNGPAPTFGGSIGWAGRPKRGDQLHAVFQQREEQKQQLHHMFMGWKPSANFFALLPRHSIAEQFALSCLDEFVLYWLDKDRKETNWDQKFLGWVKREWVKKQTHDGRQQRINQQQQAGNSYENPRRDTRENRKRVTAAVMDIKDTDW